MSKRSPSLKSDPAPQIPGAGGQDESQPERGSHGCVFGGRVTSKPTSIAVRRTPSGRRYD